MIQFSNFLNKAVQKKKKYRVFEAVDGLDGLEQARERIPDMIILDLMMPEIDGFGVLEELKNDKRTQNIPVIVVSAKDITENEWQRLHGQNEGLYQKGSLPPMEFVDQVVEVIEQKVNKGDAE